MTTGRSAISSIGVAVLLLIAVVVSSVATAATEDHAVVGRFSITSDVGGAVWAFQPSGALIVTGPGEILSEGTWSTADGEREFDAQVGVTVTGQALDVLGQVSPDGATVAVYVTATEPERPDDWTPWPAESRLLGERFGMTTDPAPSPTPEPLDCARPEWVDGAVDWDRCDDVALTEA
ncbi:MAG: hypothetical protein U9O18_00685 [Chloroflexota bacterium]|nr:hypothetical protein [Chloroflexota bacterium]